MNQIVLKVSFCLCICFLWFYGFAQKPYQLEEISIIASRIINNSDGYTINLKGSEIVNGKTVPEVLYFLPNISREDGKFKINGLDVSGIYVDGVKIQDLSELDNIPAALIDRVEVKYIASSDQNSALSGGLLYISMRRPPEGGYYGNITLNVDWNQSSGFGNEVVSSLINCRYKNLSIYEHLQVDNNRSVEYLDEWISSSPLNSILKETSESQRLRFQNRISINQQFKNKIKLGGSYFVATESPHTKSCATVDNTVALVDKEISTAVQEGTLKLSIPMNKRGALMELIADYYNRHSHDKATYIIDQILIGKEEDKSNLNLWKFKADFIYPHSKVLVWKFGASTHLISSEISPSIDKKSDRFELSDHPSKTTGFTPLVYVSAQGLIWKFKYNVGLNFQLNKIGYTDMLEQIHNSNTQWSINPTLQLMMPFGAKMSNALLINFKRTLGEIPYTAISTVINWIDAYNYTIGNPNLKAQSADIAMAGVSLFRNKFNITAMYAHSHNRIYWQTFQDKSNTEVFYTKPINISGQGVWGASVEWMESPVKWWSFKLSGRIEITPENNTIGGVFYKETRCKEYFSLNNSLNLPKGWGGMLNATFEPTYHNFDRTYHAIYDLSGRIYKTFISGNLQVAMDFTAIGNRRKLDRLIGENIVSYKYTTPMQRVGLSVAWNFSGGKKVNVDAIDGVQDYMETKDNR